MPAALLDLAATLPAAPALAFLEGIGAMEMVLVAVVGLLLFGGKGLPDMARTLGKVVREFKKATANVENEVRRVMNEEPEPPRRRPAPPPPEPAGPGSAGPGSAGPGSAGFQPALPPSPAEPPSPPAEPPSPPPEPRP
jgi:sec-independent protein translocase protein TatA